MEYDDIEEFDVLTEERAADLKEEVDFIISKLQKTSSMLHDLQMMHETRKELRGEIDAISGEKKRDMESINISDPKKRKVLEDALTKYYVGERREIEHKLSLLNDDLSVLDQNVRETMRNCSVLNNIL